MGSTLREEALAKAGAYPDRPAIVGADGSVVRYRDLAQHELLEFSTTGTTGGPKRFRLTDDDMRARLPRLREVRGTRFAATRSVFIPFALDSALSASIVHHILDVGGTVYYPGVQRSMPAQWARLCADNNVEACLLVPKVAAMWALVSALAASHRFAGIFFSGTAWSADKLDPVAHLCDYLHVCYGVAEVGQIAGGDYKTIGGIPGAVGRVASDLQIDFDAGGVRLKGPGISSVYVDGSSKIVDGWFCPGDRAHFEGGILVLDGRA